MTHDAQQGPCVATGLTNSQPPEQSRRPHAVTRLQRRCVECGRRVWLLPAQAAVVVACRYHRESLLRERSHARRWEAAAAIAQAAAPAPVLPVPDAPRPVRLPDGTEAVVVWAGDMLTGAGVRGGLLADRRSAPDPLSDIAPGNWDDEARALRRKPKAAPKRRKRRPVHVVSGPRQRRVA